MAVQVATMEGRDSQDSEGVAKVVVATGAAARAEVQVGVKGAAVAKGAVV